MLGSIHNEKHRMLLQLIYSAGLRLNEGTHLKVTDIDSQRMTIHVQSGKGNKDRYTILSKVALQDLREYWKHEALNFTKWLSEPENIALLSDEVGGPADRSPAGQGTVGTRGRRGSCVI